MNQQPQALTVFNFQEQETRITLIDGNPWWLAIDVCTILDHSDVSMAVSRLDEDEKLIQAMFVSGQSRQTWLVNESGLYHLIFTSRKSEAETFRRWVTHEVLPAIRKTGRYILPGQEQIEALAEITEMRKELTRLRRVFISDKPYRVSSPREQLSLSDNIIRLIRRFAGRGKEAPTLRQFGQYLKNVDASTLKSTLNEMVAQGLIHEDSTYKRTRYELI